MTPDAAPFSGESHWWAPEILSPVLGGSAATAATRPQDAPRATLGTLAWALSQHTRSADSCCPGQCPLADGISTASTWLTGPYDGPPSAYPGLASQALPYASVADGLPGLRGADGPGTGRLYVGPLRMVCSTVSTWVHAGAAPPARPPALALGQEGGGGLLVLVGADRSCLRIGAPSMPAAAWGSLGARAGAGPWLGPGMEPPAAASRGGAALDQVQGLGAGFRFAQQPPRAAAAAGVGASAVRLRVSRQLWEPWTFNFRR